MNVYSNNKNVKLAYFAGGCFWGMEYFFRRKTALISIVSGYMRSGLPHTSHNSNLNAEDCISGKTGYNTEGDRFNNNTVLPLRYEDVCTGKTGYLETVEVSYLPEEITYEELVKYFFEIHDPTQKNGQGPDIGEQYKSAVFYGTTEEKDTIYSIIEILESKGYDIATKVLPAGTFIRAEEYHQNYYGRHKAIPYCHAYKKRF